MITVTFDAEAMAALGFPEDMDPSWEVVQRGDGWVARSAREHDPGEPMHPDLGVWLGREARARPGTLEEVLAAMARADGLAELED